MSTGSNITSLYNTLKSIIKETNSKIEKEKDNKDFKLKKEDLAPLTHIFEEILSLHKTYLMFKHQFYGLILSQLESEMDYSQRRFIDLKIIRDNISIGFNPLFLENISYAEFNGHFMSEILRLVFLHPTLFSEFNESRDEKTHEDLIISSDVEVTNIIKRDLRKDEENSYSYSNGTYIDDLRKTLVQPSDLNTISDVRKETNKSPRTGEDFSYYFKFLDKFRERKPKEPGEGMSSGNSKDGVASPDNNDGTPGFNWEVDNPALVNSTMANIINEAYNSTDEKARGLLPGSIKSAIDKMNKPPEISWQKEFKYMIGSIPQNYRKTKLRLNRLQPDRFDLSGRLTDTVIDIVVALDTSGSMSDNDLKWCINEVFGIIKTVKARVTIIECDTEIQKIYEVKKAGDVDLKMSGRGGTSFTPVVEYLNGVHPTYKSKRSYKRSVMIYFTDGFGEREIERPKTYRNLWVVLNDEKHLSLSEPFGKVKKLVIKGDI